MTNPGWLNDIFATVMIAVAVYSAGRLVAARRWSRPTHEDVEIAHFLMGTAMAGMLVSDLNPIPSGVWEVVFSILAAWFIWRCYQFVTDPSTGLGYDKHVHRLSRRLIHLVMSLAMLYMFLAAVPAAVGSGGSMAMGSATGATTDFVLLPLVFVVALFASAIWELDRIGNLSPSRTTLHQAAPVFASVGGSPNTSQDSDAADDRMDEARPPWLAPRLEAASHIAMCVTMGYMLVLML
ncbi:MAG: DUF5134 domain-containing protein [Acidimicrobiales bacterium]